MTTTNTPPSLLDDLNALPPSLSWYRDYETTYKAGLTAAFVLTGDVRGLTTEGLSHRSFLLSALSRKHKIEGCTHPRAQPALGRASLGTQDLFPTRTSAREPGNASRH